MDNLEYYKDKYLSNVKSGIPQNMSVSNKMVTLTNILTYILYKSVLSDKP